MYHRADPPRSLNRADTFGTSASWLTFAKTITPVLLALVVLTLLALLLVSPAGAAGGFEITKSTSANPVKAGEDFVYTIAITNNTGKDVNATITDTIPAGVVVKAIGSGGEDKNGILTWESLRFIPDATLWVTFTANVTKTGTIVNGDYRVVSGDSSGIGTPISTTIISNDPHRVDISPSPSSVTVGISTTVDLTIAVVDAYDNPISDPTDVTIDFDHGYIDSQPAGTTITETISGGQIVKTLSVLTVAGTTKITATAAGVNPDVAAVTVNAGSPDSLVVSASPKTISTDNGETSTIAATVQDQFGNLINNLPVTFTTSVGQLDGSGSLVTVNTSNGQATATLGGTTAGTATITVTAGALPPDTSQQVYLAPGPPTQLRFNPPTNIPVTITADGVSTTSLELQVLDKNNNFIDTSVVVTLTTDLGTLTGGGSSYVQSTKNGRVQVTLTSITRTGTAKVSAKALALQTDRSVNFKAGNPVSITVGLSDAAIIANGTSTSDITATALDKFGNVVKDTVITFTVAAGGGTLLDPSPENTTSGTIVKTLQSDLNLGPVPITVTVQGLATPTVSYVDFIVGPPYQVDVMAATTATTVANSVPLTFTVQDEWSHLIPNIPITVTPSIGSMSPSGSGNTDTGGQLSLSLFSTQAGPAAISVSSYNGAIGIINGDSVITFTPDVPSQAILAANPTAIVADGVITAVVTATVTDQYANPVVGFTPIFTWTAGTLSGSGATNSLGQTSRTLHSSTTIETASVDVENLTATPTTVDFVVGPPDVAILSANPTTAFVKGLGSPDKITLAITVTDRVGHLIVGKTLAVTSTFGQVSNCTNTDAQGKLTCDLQSTKSGSPTVYVEGIAATGDTITFNPGTDIIYIMVTPTGTSDSPVHVTAGQPFTFTAVAEDDYHNIIPNTTFAWSIRKGFPPGAGTIDPQGVVVGEQTGRMVIEVSSGGAFAANYIEIDPGPADKANLTIDPKTVPIGSFSKLTLQVTDQYDNPIDYYYCPTAVTTFGSLKMDCTDTKGIAVGWITSITKTGTANISVQGLSQVTGDDTVVFTAGAPAQVKATASITSLHANGTDTTPVTFTIQDNYANPVAAGYTMYSVQTSLGTLACPSKRTDGSGQIYCTLTAPTVEGNANFSVNYKVNQTLINNGSDTVNFFIGRLDHLIIDPAGPLTTTAGMSTTLQVDAYDAGNALIPASRLTYDWYKYVSAGGGDGRFTPLPATSDQTTFISELEGLVEARVLVSQKSDNFSVPPGFVDFNIIAAPPSQGDILVSPSSVLADGATPFTITLTALQDSLGNQARDGDTVSFAIGPPSNQRIVSGTISAGQVQVVLTTTTQAGTYPISVTNSASEAVALTGSALVTFTPGAPAQASIVSAVPPAIIADGTSTSDLVLQLKDRFGNNVVSGWNLNYSSSLGTLTSGGATDSSGQTLLQLTAGLVVGTAQITVDTGASTFVASGSVPLLTGPPVRATIVAAETTLVAGGSGTTVEFLVEDNWGHPVDGYVITPTITPALGWFAGSRVPSKGKVIQVLAPFTSTGLAVVGSQGLTVTGNTDFTFVPNVASMAHVSASPKSLTVNNPTALVVTVKDAYGNIVTPTQIAITSVLSGIFDGGTASVITRTTAGGTGEIAATLNSKWAGYETLSLRGPNGPLTLTPSSDVIEFRPDTMIRVVLDKTQPVIWMAGVPLPLMASSLDKYDNVIDPWAAVDYFWEQTSVVNGPGYGTLNGKDTHNRTVDFIPEKVGVNHIKAINSTFNSVPLTVTVIAAPPTQAFIPSTPASIMANNSSTTTVQLTNLKDAFGNDVADGHLITATVDSRVATGLVSGGEANITITATKRAGTHQIFATSAAGSINLSGADKMTFLSGVPAKAVVKASQKIIPVDAVTATLAITVYDKYDNLVANGTAVTATVSKATVGNNSATTVNGKTTRTIAPISTGKGTVAVGGPQGTLFVQGDTELTFVPGSAVYATITAQQIKLIGNGISSTQLSAALKDGMHFPTNSSGGLAVITVTRGTIVPTMTTVTNGSFNATFTADRSVGPVDISITYNGVSMIVEGDKLTQIPDVADSAVLTASATSLRIDTSDQSTLTFDLFDQWGNPVAGGTVVTITASAGIVTPVPATTVGNQVTAMLSPGTSAGPVSFTIEAAGTSGPLRLSGDSVQILPGVLDTIRVLPNMSLWVNAGNSIALSAVGYDKYDNQSSTGPFLWKKVFGNGDGLLNNGVFTGTIVGNVGIQAYTGTVFSTEKSVTVLPGPLATAIVSATPLTVPIGGVPSSLTITARDAYGNRIADGTAAAVTVNLGTISGSGTAKNGVLTRTLLSSIFSGRAEVFVNGKKAGGDTVFFSPRAWMSAIPATAVADGTSEVEVSIRLLDGDGQPTGAIPKSITSTLGIINYSDCQVGLDSTFKCQLKASTQTGQALIYADGYPAQGVVTFTVGTPSVANISVDPPYVTVNGLNTSILTIDVYDDYGHKITDYSKPLTVTSSLGSISGVEPTIDGTTQRVLTGGSVAGTATLSVQGLPKASGDTQIDILDVVAHIAASPAYLTADGVSQSDLTITLQDTTGQVLTHINTPLTTTTSLGSLGGIEATVAGVTQRTLTAGTTVGTAILAVEKVSNVSGDARISIYNPVVNISASPPYQIADGASLVTLDLALEDINGQALNYLTTPLTVAASLGSISDFAPTIDGSTQRTLSSNTAGIANISISNFSAVGDKAVRFIGAAVLDGDFEDTLGNWEIRQEYSPLTETLVYTVAKISNDIVGNIVVQPRNGSTSMVRLGATTADNSGHAVGKTWLKQRVYVPESGVTQASFWYRLLSYDVKVGSAERGSKEYDPFEVYLKDASEEIWSDGYEWSYEWQSWYASDPESPNDMGWKQGVLDLTPYAGEIVSLEFRVSNLQIDADNTWIYLDDVTVINREVSTGQQIFLPLIIR